MDLNHLTASQLLMLADYATTRAKRMLFQEYAATYHPGAVRLYVKLDSEYDDEGGYFPRIVDIRAETADGTEVPFHLDGKAETEDEEFYDVKDDAQSCLPVDFHDPSEIDLRDPLSPLVIPQTTDDPNGL